jgi:hypothetical protein
MSGTADTVMRVEASSKHPSGMEGREGGRDRERERRRRGRKEG